MQHRVVITGLGVISVLGDSPEALHTALCAGQSGAQPITLFDTEALVCKQAHELATFAPDRYLGKKNFRALDRTSRLVTSAAKLALDHSRWELEKRQEYEVGLVLGTMFCSVHTIAEFDRRGLTLGPSVVSPMDFANTVINAAAGQAAIWHNLRGINSTIAGGITAGLQALAYATELIRSGQATALLAGGAEELCFESFYGFERAGLLSGSRHDVMACAIPFDARRDGFTLGEGVALLMLEDAELAAARGASVLAEIVGHGNAYDLSRGTEASQTVPAIARAMRLALQDAQLSPVDVACVSASANGSVLLDRYEAEAIANVFQETTPRLPVTAVKSMLGETLGASGALQSVALLTAMHDAVLPGIHHLQQFEADFPLPQACAANRPGPLRNGVINAVGLDGNCCSLVLAQPQGGM
jgi:3-oxoacyl-[acyl-carrier-protein] synthase II